LIKRTAPNTSGASLTGFPVTDVATISTGVRTYFASACFSFAKIARISSPMRRALSRRSVISCGVSRIGAVGGSLSAPDVSAWSTVSQSARPSARARFFGPSGCDASRL
jgi:hypothetical protein